MTSTVTQHDVAGAIARLRNRKAFRAFMTAAVALVVGVSLYYSYAGTSLLYTANATSLLPTLQDVVETVQTYQATYGHPPKDLDALGTLKPKYSLRPFTMHIKGDVVWIVENIAIPRQFLPDMRVSAFANRKQPLCPHGSTDGGFSLGSCDDPAAALQRWQSDADQIAAGQRRFTLALTLILVAATLCAIGIAGMYLPGQHIATLLIGSVVVIMLALLAGNYFGIAGGAIVYTLLALGALLVDLRRDRVRE